MTGPLVKNVIRRAPKGWERVGHSTDEDNTAYPSISFNVNENHPLAKYNLSITIKPVFMQNSSPRGFYSDFDGHPHKDKLEEMKDEIERRYKEEDNEDSSKDIEFEVRQEYLPFEFDEWCVELNINTIPPFLVGADKREDVDFESEVLPERTNIFIEVMVSEDKEIIIEKARELMKKLETVEHLDNHYISAKESLPHIRTLNARHTQKDENPETKEIFIHDLDQLEGKSNVKYFEEKLETIQEQLEIAKDVEEIVVPDK